MTYQPKKKLIKIINIILSAIIILVFIWFKFIRIRVPREIPLDLSIFGGTLLLIVCLTYIHTIYILIISRNKIVKEKSMFNLKFIKKLLDQFNNLIINNIYFDQIMYYIVNKLYIHSYLLLCLQYLIRFLLIILLVIDIYNSKLNYIYKGIYLYLIIYLIRYFLYSCKLIYQKEFKRLDTNVTLHKTITSSAYDTQYFIHVLTILKHEEKPPLSYTVCLKDSYIIEGLEILSKQYEKPRLDVKNARKNFQLILNFLVNTNIIIFNYYNLQKKDRILDIIIAYVYLVCWSYILIVSLHNLHISSYDLILFTIRCKEEPFSGLQL